MPLPAEAAPGADAAGPEVAAADDGAPAPRAQSRAQWGDLRTRVLSAGVLAPIGLLCLWFGGWPWAVLVGLAVLGMAREWIGLCRVKEGGVSPGFAARALAVVALAAVLTTQSGRSGAALVLLAFGALVVLATAPARRVALAAGLPYVALGGVALVWLRGPGAGETLFLILLVWASDIGAYAVGRVVGGRKLAPRISPGKTWSGAVGGLVAAMAVGLGFALLAPGPRGAVIGGVLVGGLLGVVSQAGDLLESAVKRHFGVKDSGGLIPGHGGLLDRLDGLLTAAPVAALLTLAHPGLPLWGAPLWEMAPWR